jgi:serine/threonine protein kinase
MSTDVIANKYKIVREIARSNDVVYEAIDATMGRRLAVKELVIPPNLTGTARRERIERFNREARAAGRLSHPNIVTVYDFGEDNGRYFIAMEFLEGGTLRDRLQACGALEVDEAVDIACQVLSALAHAHSHKVIHRDVKPDNIHILSGGQIKLTDFGIARLTEEASLTGEGQVFGTPSYMSPEQIEGHSIDHRSDLFSLGIVLYEMLAGRKPFTGDSVVSITYNIMHAEPPPLPGAPYAVEHVILRALSKDPMRRFHSAEEMRQALKAADTSVPALFLPPGTQTNMGRGAPDPLTSAPSYGGPGTISGGYTPPPFGVSIPPPSPQTVSPPPVAAGAGGGNVGTFVHWGQPGAPTPSAAQAPPLSYPPARSGPRLSPGALTFLKALLLALILGVAVLGFILLFWNAYEQQRKTGASQAIQQLLAEGAQLFNRKQYEQAAAKFEEAMQRADTPEARKKATEELVNACNAAGARAFELRDDRTALKWWHRAYELDPNNEDILYNLDQVYKRLGGQDLKDWQQSKAEGRVGSPNPAAPGSTTDIDARVAQARQYLDAGNQAYSQGDVETARDYWQKAVGEAPGTDPAMQAQQFLNQTTSRPNF